jgi:hypothetical protein
MPTATLQQIRLTPLDAVLVSGRTQNYTYYKQYPGWAILRLDRSTFWVHDIEHQLGVVVSSFGIAEEVIEQLATSF